MKGVILVVFEDFARGLFGRERWSKLREEAGVSEPLFVPMDDYPDEQFISLVKATSSAAEKSVDEIIYDFGLFVIPEFVRMYEFFFKPHTSARELLLKMDEVHAVSTQTIFGAKPPRFQCEKLSDGSLVVKYSSQRKMCSFLRGLIEGVARHYKERVKITERTCMKQGAPRCELAIDFLDYAQIPTRSR